VGGVAAEVAVGGQGQLDVVADGALVFSKRSTGRFPEPGEVERLVRALRVGSSS
jgi:predicted Rdx family selenoprotein